MSKSVGIGPSSYEKRIYWAAFSQGLRNTVLEYSFKIVAVNNLVILDILIRPTDKCLLVQFHLNVCNTFREQSMPTVDLCPCTI